MFPWLKFKCPDCNADCVRNGAEYNCPACSRIFKRNDNIIYALPGNIHGQEIKQREKTGWDALSPKEIENIKEHLRELPFIEDESAEPTHYREAARQFRLSAEFLSPLEGKRGLDLGGSIGWASYRFAQHGAQMILADFNDSPTSGLGAANIYLEAGLQFERICMDAENLPFSDGQFDFVFSCAFLHHLTQPWKVVQHIGRVLKPGGVYVCAAEGFCPFWMSRENALSRCNQAMEYIDQGINEQVFYQKEYNKGFRDAGLSMRIVNPRWDQVASGTIHPGLKMRNSNYIPEILENRMNNNNLMGLLSRFILRYRLWRPLAHPFVFRKIRNRILNGTQKFRILIGHKRQ